MIAVKNVGSYAKGAIEYNEDKILKEEALFLSSNYIFSQDKDTIINTFNEWNSRGKSMNNCVHFTISLDYKDNVSDDVFNEIGREFMERIGYANQPFVIYKHNDRKHEHLHIVSTPIDKNGKKIKDSNDYKVIMEASRAIESKYGLVCATDKNVNVLEKFLDNKEKSILYKPSPLIMNKDLEVRSSISEVMDYILKNEYILDFEQLKDRLQDFNVGIQRKEFNDGKKGHSLFILDEKGNQVSKAIKNSDMKKSLHLKFEKMMFDNNAKKLDRHTNDLKKLIGSLLKNYEKITPETFQKILSEYNIDVKYNYGNGIINGIGYFDASKNQNFKGKALGYEAAFMNTLFSDKDVVAQQSKIEKEDAIQQDYNNIYNRDLIDVINTRGQKVKDPNKEKKKRRKRPRL